MAKQTGGGALARQWHFKTGSSQVYRTLCGHAHLVCWTGLQVRTVAIATGETTGKAKADGGAPWMSDEGVWVPTSKGFEVRAPDTLELVRKIAVPTPKGTTYVGGITRVYGATSYRLYRVNEGTSVDGAHVQDYQLQAYDLGANEPRYLVSVLRSSRPGVKGDCSADAFAVAARADAGFEVVAGSTADGRVTGTSTRAQCNLDVARGQVVDRRHGDELSVLRDGAWHDLGVRGDLQVIGEHVYGVGHRELVRFDDAFAVAARVPISTPPSSGDDGRVPPTSACLVGDDLVVVERRDPYPESGMLSAKPTTGYHLGRRDPATLAVRGPAPADFTELFGFHLVAYADGVYVAKVFNGFIGLRLRG